MLILKKKADLMITLPLISPAPISEHTAMINLPRVRAPT